VIDHRLIHVVAADADGGGGGDIGERHDGDFRRAAAGVADHRGGRLRDGQARPDPRRHGLIDEKDLAGAGPLGAVDHGPALDRRNAAGHRDHDARAHQSAPAVNLADEVAQHLLGDFEVTDDAVFERTNGADRAGGFAQHLARDQTDGLAVIEDNIRPFSDGDDGRLVQNNSFVANTNQRGTGTEIDPHVHAEKAELRPTAQRLSQTGYESGGRRQRRENSMAQNRSVTCNRQSNVRHGC
jgi:hypothetical protein